MGTDCIPAATLLARVAPGQAWEEHVRPPWPSKRVTYSALRLDHTWIMPLLLSTPSTVATLSAMPMASRPVPHPKSKTSMCGCNTWALSACRKMEGWCCKGVWKNMALCSAVRTALQHYSAITAVQPPRLARRDPCNNKYLLHPFSSRQLATQYA